MSAVGVNYWRETGISCPVCTAAYILTLPTGPNWPAENAVRRTAAHLLPILFGHRKRMLLLLCTHTSTYSLTGPNSSYYFLMYDSRITQTHPLSNHSWWCDGGGFFGSRDRINFQKWHVKRDPYFGLILFGSSRHFKGAMIFFYASVL